MYRYNSYIARHLTHSTLLITFSLTSIVWLTQALRFIDFIVNQGVSIAVFLQLTMLLVPALLFMILPAALFCSILFVYNKLKMDSELVVMRAAGLSNWYLARPALIVCAVVMAVTYFISLYLQPISYKQFKDSQTFLRNNYASLFLQDGVFSNPVEGLMVFIRERDKNDILHGILVYDSRQPAQSIAMMAEEGKLVATPEGPRFLLMNGNRQEMRNGRLSFLNFESYTLDMSMYAKEAGDRVIDPQELFLPQLFADDPNLSPAENMKRRAEGHQRLIWPAYTLSLTMVGLAVMLSGEFNRRGHWKRVTLAGGMGAAMLFASVGLRGVMALKPAIVLVAYGALLVPLFAACWILSDHIKIKTRKQELAHA